MVSPMQRWNDAWESATIHVYEQESGNWQVGNTADGTATQSIALAMDAGIPTYFTAQEFDSMLTRASEHGYCFAYYMLESQETEQETEE